MESHFNSTTITLNPTYFTQRTQCGMLHPTNKWLSSLIPIKQRLITKYICKTLPHLQEPIFYFIIICSGLPTNVSLMRFSTTGSGHYLFLLSPTLCEHVAPGISKMAKQWTRSRIQKKIQKKRIFFIFFILLYNFGGKLLFCLGKNTIKEEKYVQILQQ